MLLNILMIEKIKELELIYENYKDINSIKVKKWFNDEDMNKLIIDCNKEENFNYILDLVGKEIFNFFNPSEIINFIIEKLINFIQDKNYLLVLTIFTKIYFLFYYLKFIYNNLKKFDISKQRILYTFFITVTNYLMDIL